MSEYICDVCGKKYSEEEIRVAQSICISEDDCDCKTVKLVIKLKKQIKELKTEVTNLNTLLTDAQECDWDVDSMYKDFRDGTLGGRKIDEDSKPNKKLASWFAKRHNLNEKELED